MRHQFDSDMRGMKRAATWFAVIAMAAQLAFLLGLIARHFGVL